MGSLTCILVLFLAPMLASAQPLDRYQWKNRLILFSLTDDSAGAELRSALETSRRALDDRDIVLIDLSTTASRINGTTRPAPDEVGALRKKWDLPDDPATFILVGKDGGTKARQQNTLDLDKFLALIDTMPMRKQEMKQQRK